MGGELDGGTTAFPAMNGGEPVAVAEPWKAVGDAEAAREGRRRSAGVAA